MPKLYETIFYSKKLVGSFSNEAVVNAMLRFEAALAKAQARHEMIPTASALIIERNCLTEKIDIEKLIQDASPAGNINIPLVKQLTSVIAKENEEAAKFVHFGATSQDVIDTAIMMQSKEAVKFIAAELDQLIQQLVSIAREHRSTVMVGRSFLQHARPITFGFKVAGWLDALLRSKRELKTLLHENFVLQLGGAVGTASAFAEKFLGVSESMAQDLGLNVPTKPWHTQRDRFARLATTLGLLSGNIGKMAKDISLMTQTEIGEISEPTQDGKGGSSTMPHKKNPVGCISILSNTVRTPGLVSTMLSCMEQDHERATGPWHAEWETIEQILQLTAGALSKAVEITNGIEVHKDRMLANLDLTGGLIYAENVSLALSHSIGKSAAHSLLEDCSKEAHQKKIHLKNICLQHPLITRLLSPDKIEMLFNPELSIGNCEIFIDRVLSTNT